MDQKRRQAAWDEGRYLPKGSSAGLGAEGIPKIVAGVANRNEWVYVQQPNGTVQRPTLNKKATGHLILTGRAVLIR